nr:MAG TPA: BNR/Asp-box repeat protein [Bacteriophage sp.]
MLLFSFRAVGVGHFAHVAQSPPPLWVTCKALYLYRCKDNGKNRKLQPPILGQFQPHN